MTNRRNFLKGAFGGTAAAVAVPATLFAGEAQASELPKKWDITADVVVCGWRHDGHRRCSERREGARS